MQKGAPGAGVPFFVCVNLRAIVCIIERVTECIIERATDKKTPANSICRRISLKGSYYTLNR